jgi:hypothetical protein
MQVVVKTPKEKVREISIPSKLYRTVRSFVESSLDLTYPWRMGYEFSNHYVWRKDRKWKLIVYKDVEVIDEYTSLPVVGIYRIEQSQMSVIAELCSMSDGLNFVVLKDIGLAVMNPRYPHNLAFIRDAPIAFISDLPMPFIRPISVREIIDTLSKYVGYNEVFGHEDPASDIENN